MAALLKDAIKPNRVQTIEGTPAFVRRPVRQHRPRLQLRYRHPSGETPCRLRRNRSGFRRGFERGKILRHQMPSGGLKPDAAVVVATVRALKYNGGVERANLGEENLDALAKACLIC